MGSRARSSWATHLGVEALVDGREDVERGAGDGAIVPRLPPPPSLLLRAAGVPAAPLVLRLQAAHNARTQVSPAVAKGTPHQLNQTSREPPN
jgi:hypothetical protein